LWDSAILYSEDGCFTEIEDYIRNMRKILRVLKSTGAKVIFATTTPVSDEKKKVVGPLPPAHRNDDIIRYNAAVLEAFKDENVYINDLFSLMYDHKEKYLSEDMIHPNQEGIQLLGAAVARSIRDCPVSEKTS
jgi:acyl-CoA thioesterase-1